MHAAVDSHVQRDPHMQVKESWRLILRGRGMSIEVQDVRVYAGSALAYVTCVEVMESGDARGRHAGLTRMHTTQGSAGQGVACAESSS